MRPTLLEQNLDHHHKGRADAPWQIKIRVVDFVLDLPQQKAFDLIKIILAGIKLVGGDPYLQQHLATDA
ncbi:uncharacterized protein N7503_004543 [Penicillium pulvis]|uniref:uncharacterized protein n=1 Tax=Penicillium pulvis TaxID=1562058 RepID=UPI0025481162|nr:uncharacterized protein N7503_004543 [Penicillium pulvis]KAJ5802093.1 hypothetical protein N7503_004543 [Penicillium pulvis]